MELKQALETRRSIRAFTEQKISDADLMELMEAARIAPSAANKQKYQFVIISGSEVEEFVPLCRNQAFVGQASHLLIGCATDKEFRWGEVDTAIAIDHLTLKAHDMGLGSCWIGAFDAVAVSERIGLTEEAKVVAILAVGYPAAKGVMRSRKTMDELISWGKYRPVEE